MKTKEEIENICSNIVDSESINDQHKQSVYEGCVLGYTQCQEDIKQKLYEFGKLVLDTFHSEGKTHSGNERLPRVKFDEWFNQVNKD